MGKHYSIMVPVSNIDPAPASLRSDSTGENDDSKTPDTDVTDFIASPKPIKRRAAWACLSCRVRKVRCDVVAAVPCGNCVRDKVEVIHTIFNKSQSPTHNMDTLPCGLKSHFTAADLYFLVCSTGPASAKVSA